MFWFESSDVRYSCKDIIGMSSSMFNVVFVVDVMFVSFCIYIKLLEVVVKVDWVSIEVLFEEGGVCCEDCGDIDVVFFGEGKSNVSKLFVEVGNDCFGFFVVYELN